MAPTAQEIGGCGKLPIHWMIATVTHLPQAEPAEFMVRRFPAQKRFGLQRMEG